MKTYLNTETGLLTALAGATTGIAKIAAKRGDTFLLEAVPSSTIEGAAGVFAAKAAYSGTPVVFAGSWEAPETEGAGYLFSLDLNTSDLAALFTSEIAEVTLLAEISWSLDGAIRSTQTFSLVVARDVWRGDVPTPSPVEAAQSFLLSSPDLSQWQISITNDGQLERTKL